MAAPRSKSSADTSSASWRSSEEVRAIPCTSAVGPSAAAATGLDPHSTPSRAMDDLNKTPLHELDDSLLRLVLTGRGNRLLQTLPGSLCPTATNNLNDLLALQLKDCQNPLSLDAVKAMVAGWIFKLGDSLCNFEQLWDDAV